MVDLANSCIKRYLLHVTWLFRILFSILTLFDCTVPAQLMVFLIKPNLEDIQCAFKTDSSLQNIVEF